MKDALREYGRTVAIFAAAGLVLSLLVGLLAGQPVRRHAAPRDPVRARSSAASGRACSTWCDGSCPNSRAGSPRAGEGARRRGGETRGIDDRHRAARGASARRRAPRRGGPRRSRSCRGRAKPRGAAVEELEGAERGPETAAAPAPPAEGRAGADSTRCRTSARSQQRGRRARSATRLPGARAKPSDAARDVLEREDPASLARAVRTVLKREERP